jgi:hypothetical protein
MITTDWEFTLACESSVSGERLAGSVAILISLGLRSRYAVTPDSGSAARPWWLTLIIWTVILPADILMSSDMPRRIKRRTEPLDRTT